MSRKRAAVSETDRHEVAPDAAAPGPGGEPAPTGRSTSSLTKTLRDMMWTLIVVGAIVAVLIVLNYRAPQDPVAEIDPAPLAEVADVDTIYPVLLPQDGGWRATSARYEPTPESGEEFVWFTGGVIDGDRDFASLSQSPASGPAYIAEQTYDGEQAEISVIYGEEWQRWESSDYRSLVAVNDGITTVVVGTTGWSRLERFAASLAPL